MLYAPQIFVAAIFPGAPWEPEGEASAQERTTVSSPDSEAAAPTLSAHAPAADTPGEQAESEQQTTTRDAPAHAAAQALEAAELAKKQGHTLTPAGIEPPPRPKPNEFLPTTSTEPESRRAAPSSGGHPGAPAPEAPRLQRVASSSTVSLSTDSDTNPREEVPGGL